MNQTETVALLKEIYQNARTAIDAIQVLLAKSTSAHFTDSLRSQVSQYHEIADEAAMQLRGFRELPADNPIFERIGMWASVQMSTVTNKNPGHMAEIMINGSTMGVIEMTKYLHANHNVDPAARALAHKLISTEQHNINMMKNFL